MSCTSRSAGLRFVAGLVALLSSLPLEVFAATPAVPSNETVNWEIMTEIRNEGFRNSKVMEIEEQLTDVIGPRLTGSPNMKRANEWTRDDAVHRMQRALGELRIEGVRTTIPFHRKLMRDPVFTGAGMYTRYIEQEFLAALAP